MKTDEKFLLITGGTRGIGRAITLAQAKKGVCLFIGYLRDDEAAEETQKAAQAKGARVILIPGNIAHEETISEIYEAVGKETSRLDGLIHNAALGVFKPVHELRIKDWDISLDVNAKAFLLLCQRALPLMKEKGGKIVTISSLGAGHYIPNYGAIGISKAALEDLVRYLGVEFAPYRINVNAVSGGLVDTDSLKHFPDLETMTQTALRRTPAGRIGRPEDISNVVSFLLDEASDWIYGQTLVADGGYSLC